MGLSDFVFDRDEPIFVGAHGVDDYAFESDAPIANIGGSDLVIQSGTPLGGLGYAVNGGDVKTLEPIATAETHSEFFGYDDDTNNATHGYFEAEVTTVLVHHDTVDDTYAIIISHGGPSEGSQNKYSVRTDFSESIDAAGDTLVRDDPEVGDALSDEYHDTWMGHGWADTQIDGVLFAPGAFQDVTFTLDHSFTHQDVGQADGVQDFRIITSDGSTPDGGSVEYAGRDGSIRVLIP